MHETTLAQTLIEYLLEGAQHPRGAVGDPEQRRLEPAGLEVPEEVEPRVVALRAPGGESDQHFLVVGGDASRAQKGLGALGGGCILKQDPSQYM